jgi:hypothetical protein
VFLGVLGLLKRGVRRLLALLLPYRFLHGHRVSLALYIVAVGAHIRC